MDCDEYYGFRMREKVTVLTGPFKGESGTIIRIERDCGAPNGWFTIQIRHHQCLFAGEELAKYTEHTW